MESKRAVYPQNSEFADLPLSGPQGNFGRPIYKQRFQKVAKSGPSERKELSSNNLGSENVFPQLCSQKDSSAQDNLKTQSAKALLFETCAAHKWKQPEFECVKEEGPSHMRRFTYKVTVEIGGTPLTALEGFSAPKSSKKSAAEHAAEGALWYLSHLGIFAQKK